jgi:hypothetical protein
MDEFEEACEQASESVKARMDLAKEMYEILKDCAPNLCKHLLIVRLILDDVCGRGFLTLGYLKQILELETTYQRSRPQI